MSILCVEEMQEENGSWESITSKVLLLCIYQIYPYAFQMPGSQKQLFLGNGFDSQVQKLYVTSLQTQYWEIIGAFVTGGLKKAAEELAQLWAGQPQHRNVDTNVTGLTRIRDPQVNKNMLRRVPSNDSQGSWNGWFSASSCAYGWGAMYWIHLVRTMFT